MFFYSVLTLHVLLCLVLIVLVLLQQGKGANMGAAFGGGSNTLFGASGATNALVKATTIIAVLFMMTSVVLITSFQNRSTSGTTGNPLQGSVMDGIPVSNSGIELVTPNAVAPLAAAVAGTPAVTPAEAVVVTVAPGSVTAAPVVTVIGTVPAAR